MEMLLLPSTQILYACMYICIFTLIIATVDHAYATHTSLPIIEPEERYIAGRIYDLKGIVLYNDKPASDVLVDVMVGYPDGSSEHLMVRSANDGRFSIKFRPMIQGYYTIIATSHCMDVHRSICTYQSTMLDVAVYEERIVDSICVGDECISIDPAITIMSIDSDIDNDAMVFASNDDRLVMRFKNVGDRANVILTLPSNVIDSPAKFLVMVDGMDIEHREYLASTNIRVVDIVIKDYDSDGSAVVEIIGTYVIPEFPSPISIPLAVGSILVLLILHVSSRISDLKRRASSCICVLLNMMKTSASTSFTICIRRARSSSLYLYE